MEHTKACRQGQQRIESIASRDSPASELQDPPFLSFDLCRCVWPFDQENQHPEECRTRHVWSYRVEAQSKQNLRRKSPKSHYLGRRSLSSNNSKPPYISRGDCRWRSGNTTWAGIDYNMNTFELSNVFGRFCFVLRKPFDFLGKDFARSLGHRRGETDPNSLMSTCSDWEVVAIGTSL